MHLKLPVSISVGVVVVVMVGVGMMWRPDSVPDWAEEPHILQANIKGFSVATALAHPVSWVTGTEYLRALRAVIGVVHFSKDFNTPTMKVSWTEVDRVAVQVFRPQPSLVGSPAIIYLHGGGWSIMEAGLYEDTCHRMAAQFNVVVISIDYRQSPEHPYPVPFQDSVRAVVHILSNAQALGLDPQRIAIAGDSAGGNLAAAVALRLSQPDMSGTLPPLRFQVLVYPALQMVDLNTQSYTNFSTTGLLSKQLMTQLWLSYMGASHLLPRHQADFQANRHSAELLQDPEIAALLRPDLLPPEARLPGFRPSRPGAGNSRLAAEVRDKILDPYFSPLMAHDLSGVPPAYVILANMDVLRDDGLMYVQRLRQAGVRTEVDFYPTMSHGFFLVSPAEGWMFRRAVEAFERLGAFVKEHL